VLLEIQRQIAELIAENSKGSTALYEAEKSLAEAEYELDTIEAKAFISAEGSVADRQAVARLKSAQVRLERDLRKAELNRIKVKVKSIETALMALATQAKLMQAETRL
jgi:hypothetical protein